MKIRVITAALLSLLFASRVSAGVLDNLPWMMEQKRAAVTVLQAGPGVATEVSPFRALLDKTSTPFAELLRKNPSVMLPDISGDVNVTAGGVLKGEALAADAAITVTGSIPKQSVANALGRFSARALPVLATGVALYDLAKELGITAKNAPDGSAIFTKEESGQLWRRGEFLAGCSNKTTVPAGDFPTPELAVVAIIAASNAGGCSENVYFLGPVNDRASTGGLVKDVWINCSSCILGLSEFRVEVVRVDAAVRERVLARQEFVDAVAAKSGWPSTSSLAAATAAAIAAGEVVDVIPRTVTGPAETPEKTVSETTDDSTGTKTTTKEKTKLNYKPSDWPYSPTTGTPSPGTTQNPNPNYQPQSSTNPSPTVEPTTVTITQTCVGTEACKTVTTTTPPTTPAPTPTPTPTPTTPPSDLCKDHPDILACQKLGEPPPAEKLPGNKIPVTVTPIPFAGSGSCPAPITFTVYGATHEISYQPLCDQLSILRALMLAIAGLLAAYILADSFKVS